MGANDSKFSRSIPDGITQVSVAGQSQTECKTDVCLDKIHSLQLSLPALKASSDRVVKEQNLSTASILSHVTNFDSFEIDALITLEIFEMYKEWQRQSAQYVSDNQDEIHIKVDAAEALAVKLFQRMNFVASSMNMSIAHLQEVDVLQRDIAQLKVDIQEISQSYEMICNRVKQDNAGGRDEINDDLSRSHTEIANMH